MSKFDQSHSTNVNLANFKNSQLIQIWVEIHENLTKDYYQVHLQLVYIS